MIIHDVRRLGVYALMGAVLSLNACGIGGAPRSRTPEEPSVQAGSPASTVTPIPLTNTPTTLPTIASTPQPVAITVQNAGQLQWAGQLEGHTSTIYGGFWSPDGSMLATTSQDGRVILWDTATWETRYTLEYEEGIYSRGYPWSPDGSLLATIPRIGGYGRTLNQVLVWDVSTGEHIRTITLPFEGSARAVGWSPDGEWFAVEEEYGSYQTTILIFDYESGDMLRALQPGDEGGLEWSPDGTLLATGYGGYNGGYAGYHNSIRSIRDPFGGTLLRSIIGPNDAVNWPEFSPDWSLLAFGMNDGSVILYNQEGQQVITLDAAGFRVSVLGWSPDGTMIAALSDYNDSYRTTFIWDVESGRIIATLHNENPSRGVGLFGAGVSWSPDQTILLSFGGTDTDPTLWTVAP